MTEQQRVRKKRPPVEADPQAIIERQEAHQSFKGRRSLRIRVSVGLFLLLVVFVLYRGFTTNAGATAHLIFLASGSVLIIGLNYLIASNDPDPDPEATKRELSEQRKRREEERAVLAEKRAIENAELARVRDEKQKQQAEEKAERDRVETIEKAERDRIYAEQKAVRDREASELVAAMLQQQLRAERENRITELMMLAESNPKKAFKLASRDGIDLHAEAVRRVAGGAAVVGAALGAGAQAGSELVKHIVNGTGEKP